MKIIKARNVFSNICKLRKILIIRYQKNNRYHYNLLFIQDFYNENYKSQKLYLVTYIKKENINYQNYYELLDSKKIIIIIIIYIHHLDKNNVINMSIIH